MGEKVGNVKERLMCHFSASKNEYYVTLKIPFEHLSAVGLKPPDFVDISVSKDTIIIRKADP